MAEQPLPEGTDTIIDGAGVSDDEPGIEATPVEPETEEPEAPKQSAADAVEKPAPDSDAEASVGGNMFERIEAFRSQGYDKAREYAVQGKDRATGALDDVLRMINDTAAQVDDKVGSQYGDYARRAAESLGGFNEALKNKDVDELFNDARALIARAPAVAVGAAAALGFVVARLAKAGLDERPHDDAKSATAKPAAEA